MQYRGSILSLDGFRGPVYILRNTYYNNTVGYSSCDSVASDVSTGTFTTDNYPSYGSKSVMQINSLISIVNYVYSFEMI
jgi:hypothetical protein